MSCTSIPSVPAAITQVREELLKRFDTNPLGVIINAGRFKGEALYVPYYYEKQLNGECDRDAGNAVGFNVTEEDRKHFPELRRRHVVWISVRGDGLVVETYRKHPPRKYIRREVPVS